MSNPLRWDVFVSAQIPVITSDLPPGVTERRWSPISSTLISGKHDAVLVDTFITLEENRTLVEWIAASGKNLSTIYETHGHGDHFFGVNTIRQRFPNAQELYNQMLALYPTRVNPGALWSSARGVKH